MSKADLCRIVDREMQAIMGAKDKPGVKKLLFLTLQRKLDADGDGKVSKSDFIRSWPGFCEEYYKSAEGKSSGDLCVVS